MGRQRKSYSAAFKAQVALAAIRGDCTANELAAKHGLHPTLISNWKKALLEGAESLFVEGGKSTADDRPDPAELFEQVGRLKMDLEWLETTCFAVRQPALAKGRTHQTIQVSFDDGLTWPVKHHLLLDEGRGAGYPSLTRIGDHHVGIVYEGSQAHLVFEKFLLAELLEPATRAAGWSRRHLRHDLPLSRHRP